MNRTLINLLLSASALTFSPALAQTTTGPIPASASSSAPVTAPPTAPPTTPLQVSIAIGGFACKASRCTSDLGNGIADALATALLETGKFSLLERENLAGTTAENFFNATNPTARYEGADVVVFGSITNLDVDGQSGGLCLFGVCLGGKESVVGADLRIVDVKTSRVIAGTHIEGKSSSSGISMNLGNLLPGLTLNGNQSSSVQAALNNMLKNAVDQLIQRIPASYYR